MCRILSRFFCIGFSWRKGYVFFCCWKHLGLCALATQSQWAQLVRDRLGNHLFEVLIATSFGTAFFHLIFVLCHIFFFNWIALTLKAKEINCIFSAPLPSERSFLCFYKLHSFFFVVLFLPGCYLSFPANKLVSGEHCKIVKDQMSGLVWIEDTR